MEFYIPGEKTKLYSEKTSLWMVFTNFINHNKPEGNATLRLESQQMFVVHFSDITISIKILKINNLNKVHVIKISNIKIMTVLTMKNELSNNFPCFNSDVFW